MKKLIQFNESKFKKVKEVILEAQQIVQNALDEFNLFGFQPIQNSELSRLFVETKELFFEKATNGNPVKIGSNVIDKIKAIELIQKPEGYEDFLFLLDHAKAEIAHKKNNITNKPIIISEAFEINDKNVLVIKQSYLDFLEERCKIYAISDTALKLHELSTLIIEKCKEPEISELLKHNPDGIPGLIKSLIEVNSSYGKITSEININAIKKFN